MEKHSLIITSLSLGLLLSGCGQLFGSKASRPIPLKPLKAFKTSHTVKKVWEVKTGSAMGDHKIHPYIDAQSIFVAGAQSASSWKKSNGKLNWKTNIGEIISAGVNGPINAINNTQLFIGTVNGNAISLNAKTGKVLWIERLSSEIQSVSPSSNGRVVYRTVDGKIHGLSSNTGELIWQASQSSPTLSLHGTSVPIIIGSLVVAGFDNGKIAAYQLLNGKKAWEVALAEARGNTETDRIIDIDGKLTSIGTALFGASLHGSVNGIDTSKGAVVAWKKPFSTSTGVNANLQGIFSSDDKGNIWRITPNNGKPIWKMDDLQRYEPTLPALAGDSLLVIGDKKGNIHWVNAITGLFVARNKSDLAGYSVEPEVNGKSVYSIGKSGILSRITW